MGFAAGLTNLPLAFWLLTIFVAVVPLTPYLEVKN